MPPWEPRVRRLLAENAAFFPPTNHDFLLAWIERESDGRHDAVSSLGEVGYFQLHPAEIEDMVGASRAPSVVAEIRSSPTQSIRWGGALLQHYAAAIRPFEIPDGTRLFHGLLKTMHTSRPRGIRWLRLVREALGRNPRSFEEFLATTVEIKQRRPDAPPLPSCSAFQVLQRVSDFSSRGTGGGVWSFVPPLTLPEPLGILTNRELLWPTIFGQSNAFPGLDFTNPVAGGSVSSGWGEPRPGRAGVHEGIDLNASVGTLVHAVADGEVAFVTFEEFAGRFITILHPAGWVSRYMHLSRTDVRPGDRVRRGQVIGAVGRTGRVGSSTPTHLHFDLHLQRDRVPLYTAKFGRPRDGYGRTRQIVEDFFTAVPAEPLIPVAGYSDKVIRIAEAFGVKLFRAGRTRGFPVLAVAAFGALAVGFWGALRYIETRGA